MNKKELIAELKKLGLSDEVLSGIEDDQLEGLVEKLKPRELAFDDFLKESKNQGEFDRRVAKALETQKKKLEEPNTDPKPQDVDPDPKKKDEIPNWAKTLLQKVESIEKGKIEDTKRDSAKTILSKSEVLPDDLKQKWISRIDINSETSLEDQTKALEEEYSTLVQSYADKKTIAGPTPNITDDKEPSKEEIDNFINI
ncbi:hypothetical protein [Aquimarina sp. AU119]|uniref:hypothetical protein n=1 Tax=Aquimarina sp. AU119 TaxID=2108528 RepID=UPI000D6980E6|nr:hypothetical protein [Aquimarina sp. AU119]